MILPLHPRTRARIAENQLDHLLEGLNLQEPLGYLEMVAMERDAAVIVTDSGGVQKEAFFYKVPCLVLQDETGWTELIDAGWNTLHPPKDANAIHQAILDTIGKTGSDIAPYGDGNSAQKIIDILGVKLS